MNDSQAVSLIGTEFSAGAGAMAPRIASAAEQDRAGVRVASRSSAHPRWKRTLDIVCIFLALPALVPLMALIAVAIKAFSPGPVFFRQVRVGHRRENFLCWKFRTMKVGADGGSHQDYVRNCIRSNAPMTKLDRIGDPRLVPGGAILRATGLDELPQLINVWRGEMSLVGPRPCTTYELDDYRPDQHPRFDTLPGLTGLWQVSGKNRTTFEEMIDLDIRYARTKSLPMDLFIMARTFATVAGQVRDTCRGRQTSSALARARV